MNPQGKQTEAGCPSRLAAVTVRIPHSPRSSRLVMARSNIDLIYQLTTSWICVRMAEVSGSTPRVWIEWIRWINGMTQGVRLLLVLACRRPHEHVCTLIDRADETSDYSADAGKKLKYTEDTVSRRKGSRQGQG